MAYINYSEKKENLRYNPSLSERQDIDFVNQKISQMVKLARADKGLTQTQLAKKLKTKQPSIARLESGKTPPSISFLNDIARALDTFLIEPRFDSVKHYYNDNYAKVVNNSENESSFATVVISDSENTRGVLSPMSSTNLSVIY